MSKNKSLDNVSDQDIKAAQNWINTLPKKSLIILVLMTISTALFSLYKLSNLILQFAIFPKIYNVKITSIYQNPNQGR